MWKPYFIERTLEGLREGDYLVYLDSGAFYIRDVRYLIRQMEKDSQDIMAFELPFKEKRYTKRDVFVAMGCDEAKYTDTNQRMATMIVFKKSGQSMQFVKEWLYYCQYEDIITDAPNHLGGDNYREFADHRHDQSIFSVLSKKYDMKAYRDPSQFGRLTEMFWGSSMDKLTTEPCYPQIIAEHREYEVNRNLLWEQMIYAYAPKRIARLYHEGFFGKLQTKNKIAVLTDNMPIKEEVYGYGMYKVVNRLLKALGGVADTVIITDRNYDAVKIDSALEGKIVTANKFHNMNHKFSDICFLIETGRAISSLRKKGIRKVFIPLGADYEELKRAYLLSRVYHMNVSVYIVDDFIEYQRKIIGNAEGFKLEQRVVKYLKEINRIFVISKGMKERIDSLTGKRTILLPLPYEVREKDIMNGAVQSQIMFIGSINKLYIQGIKDIAEVVDKVNREKELNIKLLFTYKNATEVKRLVGNYKCICSQRFEEEGELRKEMRKSMFCIMPYSDDDAFALLQRTSFPSKLIEYMSSARFIVVYGNDQNAAQQYFDENNLPQVIHGRDKDLLEKCIVKLMEEPADYGKAYTNVLKKRHSFKCIREKLIRYM